MEQNEGVTWTWRPSGKTDRRSVLEKIFLIGFNGLLSYSFLSAYNRLFTLSIGIFVLSGTIQNHTSMQSNHSRRKGSRIFIRFRLAH